jgi:hypothetical protein
MSKASPVYTPELVSELRELVADCQTWEEAKALLVKRLDVHPDNVTRMNRRHGFWKAGESQWGITSGGSEDEFNAEVETSKAATLDEVIALCGVDTEQYESRGFSIRRGAKGFGWNARFSRKPIAVSAKAEIEEFKAEFKAFVKPLQSKALPEDNKGDILLEIAAMDLHFGKLGWDEDCGENYDSKIAAARYTTAIRSLVAKAQRQGKINRILFPAGNDYLHIDTGEQTTTLGTRQDADSRFSRIFRDGRKLLVETVEYLKTIAPVDVVVCPGNHDSNSMFHLGDALECWFHADPLVTVDNSPALRKYYRYGNVIIGFTHGDKEKLKDLPLLGATERPGDWGQCLFREWHLGHRHGEACIEEKGVKIRTIASLSGNDYWHFGQGYVGNIKAAEGFLFHKEDGLLAHLYHYAKK